MKTSQFMTRFVLCLLSIFIAETVFGTQTGWAQSETPTTSSTGVLLMAHGGGKSWNEQVLKIAAQIDSSIPTEVAFGMADRSTLQSGIDKLTARGVKQIVAVPLFISSHSSVFESLEYLLGSREKAPEDLAMFAAMDHGSSNKPCPPAAASSTGAAMNHGEHHSDSHTANAFGKTQPVKSTVLIRMASALDRSPIVADILLDRAAAMSKDASREVVILVAHGPNADKENELWLADMAALAGRMAAQKKFARIDYLTVRDDAETPVRNQATAEFRKKVETATTQGYRALVVPLLLSYGGIDAGVRKRLDGLDHVMSSQALLPDSRISEWIREKVQEVQVASRDKLR